MRTLIVSFGDRWPAITDRLLCYLSIFNNGFNELVSLKDDFKTYITH